MTNYYGVEVSRDGHWLQVSGAARAPSPATTCGSPT